MPLAKVFSVIKFSAVFFALNFLFLQNSFAQTKKIDSLNTVLQNAKADTTKIKALIELASQFTKINLDTALQIANKALDLAKQKDLTKNVAQAEHAVAGVMARIGDYDNGIIHAKKSLKIWEELIYSPNERDALSAKRGKALALNLTGLLFARKADNDRAITYLFKSWQLYKELSDKHGMSKSLGYLGNVYLGQGDFSKAIDYYFKALKINEQLNDINEISSNLNNIGSTYFIQEDYTKALEFYQRSLKIEEQTNDRSGIANAKANIAGIYLGRSEYEKALEYYFDALKIHEEIGAKQLQGTSLSNIANVYLIHQQYAKASEFLSRALKLHQEIGDPGPIARDLSALGSLNRLTGKFKESEECLLKAIQISTSVNNLENLKADELRLSMLYDTLGKTALAFDHYKKYIAIRNSIYSSEQQKEQVRSEMNYEFDKKDLAEKAEQDKKNAIEKEEKQKRKMLLYFILIGLSILIVFAIILFQRFRVAQKQKQIIEHQKHLVEEHQQEILASITYAKRLQEAILPPLEMIKKYLPDSFVLYKPKSIVAGDLYWMETISQQSTAGSDQNGKAPTAGLILFAAADCTGHGVPGAMVSVVCSNALNRAVKEFKLTEPGKILDKTRDLVVETFEKSTSEVKDGMDISLLCIDKKNKKILWSGANNPLWYFLPSPGGGVRRTEEEGLKLLEIKADKQPIGKTDHAKPFTTHEIEYKKDSVFYLFTDGYADQFGGPKGKKFKYKQLSALLENNVHLTLQQQSELINKEFESWRGNLEQVDDVCVIGIKI